MTANPFDLACLAIALIFALLGLFRGLVRQIFGIAGFVGGLLLARSFAAPLADTFYKDLGLALGLATAAFGLVLFFAAEIAAKLLGNLLHGMLGSFTGTLNRLGGLALGLAKGLLIVWALASLAALAQPHLGAATKRFSTLAKLDLAHSQAVAAARDQSALGEAGRGTKAPAQKSRRSDRK